jgi:hypothetical protein
LCASPIRTGGRGGPGRPRAEAFACCLERDYGEEAVPGIRPGIREKRREHDGEEEQEHPAPAVQSQRAGGFPSENPGGAEVSEPTADPRGRDQGQGPAEGAGQGLPYRYEAGGERQVIGTSPAVYDQGEHSEEKNEHGFEEKDFSGPIAEVLLNPLCRAFQAPRDEVQEQDGDRLGHQQDDQMKSGPSQVHDPDHGDGVGEHDDEEHPDERSGCPVQNGIGCGGRHDSV